MMVMVVLMLTKKASDKNSKLTLFTFAHLDLKIEFAQRLMSQ